jgi:hypothetical protein
MGRKKLKPDFTEKEMGTHPVLSSDFHIKYKVILHKKKYVATEEIKVEEDCVLIGNTIEQQSHQKIEADTYSKVYNKSDYRLYISSLPKRAKELYLWIIYELDCNKDYVWINRERYMMENDVSKNTTTEAINDLVKANVLFISTIQSVYWVNPYFFFSGNRLEKYKNYLLKI